jgi:hypothetical protein
MCGILSNTIKSKLTLQCSYYTENLLNFVVVSNFSTIKANTAKCHHHSI